MIKKFLLLFFFFLFCSNVFAEYFHIEDYKVDITIEKNHSVYFEENIHVIFHTHRHGIFRWIPYRWYNTKFRVKIIEISASNNGKIFKKEKYLKRYYKDFIYLRIGSKNRTFRGDRYYKIIYKIKNAIVKNQFYWNVIGTGWKVPIKNYEISIQFPEIDDVNKIKSFAYKGFYGKKERLSYNIDNSFFYIKNSSLKPQEGVTVRLIFPDNFFNKIPFSQKIIWWFSDNFGFFIPVIVFAILLFLWREFGKDEKKGSIVVRYKPPENLTPAEAGTLIDDRVDNKDISATIIDLAHKGYLQIEKKKEKNLIFKRENIILKKVKSPDNNLKEHELILFNGIFSGFETSVDLKELKKYFYSTAKRFKDYMYRYITEQKKLYTFNPKIVRNIFVVAGAIFIFIAMFYPYNIRTDIFTGSLLSALFCFLFSIIMPQKSHLGAKLYRDILGFKEFIEKVEHDRLKRLAEENPQIFSEILPYAIAFNIEKKWSKKFDNINISPPTWYVGYYHSGIFSPSELISSLNDDLSSISKTIASGSTSSGGGGGFSGGGGGGGGGGSW